jgi:hypothetical protein
MLIALDRNLVDIQRRLGHRKPDAAADEAERL